MAEPKGRLTTYTANEGINIQLGQMGSAVLTAVGDSITPPDGCVIVAITVVQANTTIDELIAEDATRYMNTASAAHDYGSEDSLHGTGGDKFPTSVNLYSGFTMYGRWTSASTSAGSIICYFGK